MSAGRRGRGRAWVGCSGWMYRDWRGPFYPADLPQRRWLEHYAARFDTVEVNNTFYRLPPATTVDRWAAEVPAGFLFALKLGAFGCGAQQTGLVAGWTRAATSTRTSTTITRVSPCGMLVGWRSG